MNKETAFNLTQQYFQKLEELNNSYNFINEKSEIEINLNDIIKELQIEDWIKELPQLQQNEFLMYVYFNDAHILICVKELSWYIIQDIKCKSYRKNQYIHLNSNENKIYFAEEYEKRETLKKAIVWIADLSNKEYKINLSENITKQLQNIDLLNVIWQKYKEYTYINVNEASMLYETAYKYFKGDVQNNDVPVHPLIIEINLLLKFGHLTREEIRNFSYTDMERIMIILAARTNALGLISSEYNNNNNNNSTFDLNKIMSNDPQTMQQLLNQIQNNSINNIKIS